MGGGGGGGGRMVSKSVSRRVSGRGGSARRRELRGAAAAAVAAGARQARRSTPARPSGPPSPSSPPAHPPRQPSPPPPPPRPPLPPRTRDDLVREGCGHGGVEELLEHVVGHHPRHQVAHVDLALRLGRGRHRGRGLLRQHQLPRAQLRRLHLALDWGGRGGAGGRGRAGSGEREVVSSGRQRDPHPQAAQGERRSPSSNLRSLPSSAQRVARPGPGAAAAAAARSAGSPGAAPLHTLRSRQPSQQRQQHQQQHHPITSSSRPAHSLSAGSLSAAACWRSAAKGSWKA